MIRENGGRTSVLSCWFADNLQRKTAKMKSMTSLTAGTVHGYLPGDGENVIPTRLACRPCSVMRFSHGTATRE